MVSQIVTAHVEQALRRVTHWHTALQPDDCATLETPAARRALMLRSFVDGYWRIRRTEPMIQLAIETLALRGDADNATFWRKHLPEEAGHDVVMLADIARLAGSPAACEAILQAYPITPPSVALVGYFEWQLRHNDPHLLVVMRYFLETFFARLDPASAAGVHDLFAGECATLALHHEADADHVEPCRQYIDANFSPSAIPEVLWSLDFLAAALCESQSWAAGAVLAELRR